MEQERTRYSERYPDINVGFGSDMEKFKIRQLFTRRFWDSLRYEIRGAWRRAIHGYDGADVWNMDIALRMRLIRCLLDLADHTSGYPELPEWDGYAGKGPADAHDVRFELWRARLAEIADHFYNSLDWTENEHNKNEFEEEYRKTITLEFKDEEGGRRSSRFVPAPGYTQEQADELWGKYAAREYEIEAYKREQLETGMRKLTEVFGYLWD
jgi:hypothetical protein